MQIIKEIKTEEEMFIIIAIGMLLSACVSGQEYLVFY